MTVQIFHHTAVTRDNTASGYTHQLPVSLVHIAVGVCKGMKIYHFKLFHSFAQQGRFKGPKQLITDFRAIRFRKYDTNIWNNITGGIICNITLFCAEIHCA